MSRRAERLVAEIRRLRAMLIGLARRGHLVLGCPDHGQSAMRVPCPETCPWPALESEVKAILAERGIPAPEKPGSS
jgi:hypothetical protein